MQEASDGFEATSWSWGRQRRTVRGPVRARAGRRGGGPRARAGAVRGGNTTFTAGAMRVAYDGVDDLRQLMPDLTADEIANTDFGTYPPTRSSTTWRGSPSTAPTPSWPTCWSSESIPTLLWMRDNGVRFVPIYGRQAFKVDGRFTFWGGLTVEVSGGGPGLVE